MVNVIAKSILSQVDYKGYSVTLVDSIVDYNRDDSEVDKADNYVISIRIHLWSKNMTKGWKLIVA